MSLAIPSWPNWWRAPLWLPKRQKIAAPSLMSWQPRWLGLDRSGNSCKTCGCGVVLCTNCTSGTTPSQVQVTLGNFINSSSCTQCAPNLNATFLLNVPSSNPSDPQPMGTTVANCTWWLELATLVCGYEFQIVSTINKNISGVFVQVELWSKQQIDLTSAILQWRHFLNSDYTVPATCTFDVDMTPTADNSQFFAMADGGRPCKTNSGTDGAWTCHAKSIA